MAKFSIKLAAVRRSEANFTGVTDRMEQDANRIDQVLYSRVLQGSRAFVPVRNQLKMTLDAVQSLGKKSAAMGTALLDAAQLYERTERGILGFAEENGLRAQLQEGGGETAVVPGGEGQWDWLKDVTVGWSAILPALLSIISPVTGLLYITSGLFVGEMPSFPDPSRVPGASASAGWLGYELADGYPGITAWIGKASAQAENAWSHAEVNAYLGKAEAEAKLEGGFMKTQTKTEYKNGSWEESESLEFLYGEAALGGSFSVLAADGEAGIGTDMLGAEVSAEGSIGNAKAEAKGKFSVGEDGINANVKGEAMISAVEGKASGTINILGIEITGKVGGYAGALGVEGKIGIEDNKFVMEGGIAALLGLSTGIEIGFNEEGWSNFVDFITFWD